MQKAAAVNNFGHKHRSDVLLLGQQGAVYTLIKEMEIRLRKECFLRDGLGLRLAYKCTN